MVVVDMIMKRLSLLLCLGITIPFVTGSLSSASGQKIVKCPVQDKHGHIIKYRIGRIRRASVNNVPTLLLQISIQPDNFNREDITALAEQLKEKFCHEEHLNVALCDSYKAAKDGLLIFNLLNHETDPALRGFYDLDRTSSKESIGFSTVRGKPLDEIVIQLSEK
jgi:hypothetical protein